MQWCMENVIIAVHHLGCPSRAHISRLCALLFSCSALQSLFLLLASQSLPQRPFRWSGAMSSSAVKNVSQAALAAAALKLARRHVINTSTLARKEATGPIQYIAQIAPRAPIVRPNPVMLTPEENRRHVLKLYRKCVRSVPRILLVRTQTQNT
jgi:hypothetical protein